MKNGIPNYNEIIFTKEQEEKIVDMYVNKHISTPKIGEEFGCSYNKICKVLNKYNIKRNYSSNRKYTLNETYFDNIDTPNKAYILGLMCADGCNFPPKGTAYISLQESDRELLEKIRKEIGSTKELVVIDNSNRHDHGYSYNNMCTLNMYSRHICDSLTKLGVVRNKSLCLEFPEIDSSLHRHLLRGYFDGDGSVYRYYQKNKTTLTFTSTENFCKKIKEIVETELGIYCGIYDASNHNGITKVASLSGTSAMKLLDWMYKDADLYMERKYKRYIQYSAA
jgi:hypothetical protein